MNAVVVLHSTEAAYFPCPVFFGDLPWPYFPARPSLAEALYAHAVTPLTYAHTAALSTLRSSLCQSTAQSSTVQGLSVTPGAIADVMLGRDAQKSKLPTTRLFEVEKRMVAESRRHASLSCSLAPMKAVLKILDDRPGCSGITMPALFEWEERKADSSLRRE